jgi:hypothetical protein
MPTGSLPFPKGTPMTVIITLLAILAIALGISLKTRSAELVAAHIKVQCLTLSIDTMLEEEYYAEQREYYADREAVGLEVALAEVYMASVGQ